MAASGVDKIFDELGKMSVLDLVELKKKIEDEWGITAAAPVAVRLRARLLAATGLRPKRRRRRSTSSSRARADRRSR